MEYYNACAIPKPGAKKKEKKKINGFKDKPSRICHYCGKSNAERHEIFRGPNRQTSIEHGFQVDLCAAHHKELHEGVTPWAMEENLMWKQKYQGEYVDGLVKTGVLLKTARAEWKQLIGKFY